MTLENSRIFSPLQTFLLSSWYLAWYTSSNISKIYLIFSMLYQSLPLAVCSCLIIPSNSVKETDLAKIWLTFHIFLTDFSSHIKHVVFFFNELLGLSYMIGSLEISSFQPNLKCNKIPLVTPDMSQIVYECLVWQIWQDLSSNLDLMK